jgi:hypothetical protein
MRSAGHWSTVRLPFGCPQLCLDPSASFVSAAKKGLKECVLALLIAGADANAKDGNGDTALHVAAAENYHTICRFVPIHRLEANSLLSDTSSISRRTHLLRTPRAALLSRSQQLCPHRRMLLLC